MGQSRIDLTSEYFILSANTPANAGQTMIGNNI